MQTHLQHIRALEVPIEVMKFHEQGYNESIIRAKTACVLGIINTDVCLQNGDPTADLLKLGENVLALGRCTRTGLSPCIHPYYI